MMDRTDSPEVVLTSLRIVEAVSLEDVPRLQTVLHDAAGELGLGTVLLSLASFAEGLLRTLPDWEAKLQEWMIATELDTLNGEPEA